MTPEPAAPALPPEVEAALAAPRTGERFEVEVGPMRFSALRWPAAGGPPLLLVHGVTASADIWWRIGPALGAAGHDVVALDLPGHGRTGGWIGRSHFRETAEDVAAFIRAAGLDRPALQVVGHSWGAMVTAALPTAGIRPATIVLLDPPVLPLEVMGEMASDPGEQTYEDVDVATAAIRADHPDWSAGDIAAKANALTDLDEAAARAVVLENGDWDGGLTDLDDRAAAGIDVWLLRGDPREDGAIPDEAVGEFRRRLGGDHILEVPGGHSPQRMHPAATVAAILRAVT